MADVKIDGVLSSHDGFNLLVKEVKARTDEIKFDPTINENVMALGFESFKVDDPKGTFDVLAGVTDLEEVDEFGNLPLIEDEIVGEKGYDTVRRGGKRGLSRRTFQYLMNAKATDDQLPDFVKKDIDALTKSTERLIKRATKSKNFEMTRVLTEGLNSNAPTAFGPGSAGIDGKKLFATDHPISISGKIAGTQSNKIDGVLNKTNLLAAIELLRAMRDQNGTRMGTPTKVTLVVPSELYRTALETTSGGLSFDGTEAANSNVPNTFLWEGYQIKIVVLETLNQPTKKGTVGDDTQWFVLDEERVRDLEMFKFIWLYDNIIEFTKDDSSKTMFYDIDLEFSADHFNYQGIVGSTGTV